MARKIYLFTRYLKGWMTAFGEPPADATGIVELSTEREFGWNARRGVSDSIPENALTSKAGEPLTSKGGVILTSKEA